MFARKRKRSRGGIWLNQKGIVHVYALFSGGLITLGLGLYFPHLKPQIPPPAYEEESVIESDLNRALSQIDNAIYDSLYQGEDVEKRVIFTEAESELKQEQDWDLTELLLNVPDRHTALRLQKCINAQLKPLGRQISLKTVEVTDREIVCHVSALGLNTHRIRLIYGVHEEKSYEGLPRIALIIDDLGYDLEMAISFLQLDLPLTFSVLPIAPHTEAIVQKAKRRGRELMLHLPMEPKNYPSLDPGPGALLTEMDETDIRRILEAHLSRIEGSQGVNHHMGSRFTERNEKMGIVLRELKKRNLFYIDSRTTKETVALEMAKEMGLPSGRRHVFLDNELSPKRIRFQVERLLGMARRSGTAIGIAHPHKETLQALKEYQHRLENGVKVVPASELVGSYDAQKLVNIE
jgi:polysaccharide deacetylase 2 family uncharacterized protein YibQ